MAGWAAAPRTRYASCGEIDIAYQVFGDGPIDLLVLPGPLIPIDCVDSEPSMYRFHRRLASFCRVVRFDQRGIGLSSRIPSLDMIGPECWAKDAIGVMDAVGCERATIFAPGFTSLAAVVLAADYPDRVNSLVIVNGAARTLRAPDYPIGTDVGAADPYTTIGIEPDAVEQGFDILSIIAPSVAGNGAFRAWWDMAGNRAASPSMARAFIKKIREADVRDRLERVTVPTLIVHRDNPSFSPVAHAQYLAERIAGSHLVELPGEDVLYWVGDTAPMLDEIEEFITGVRGVADTERLLTTIVFTDIVGSTERAAELGDDRWRDLLDNHDTIVRHELQRFGGHEVNTAGDGFVATFSSPSAAIACADAIVDAVRVLGIEVRVGIHAGEVEVRGASKSDVAGMTVHIGARVTALAGPSEVLVSSTVREIVTGSRHRFAERGESALKGVPGHWRLYALVREHTVVRR
ncbi:adenylate/guanylate cyclase domain-containing protein [Mycobacterium malmoense]|uniref:Adenylate/guanylate cyclase domain-containing protein n=1 Tax=Mycobacterium malmoense TaxID=1780 RepID=A0ABX3SXT8_MYCMA|nr:adenylate/guanylate cyclase domain-containing protein [Mycobacterium malmoense]OIN78699.1 adenylate/guanylate cyclase domain-containing protein [Mycobacterium malmoense]ORA85499.1 adenylate/guanylate cyclase domain-containing protein [Mycobacterium malmoense]QZA17867.1 adenylate/guanylate cyclase domain-containing protein [Mycobacterium malmoense]UNB94644.1 adenylate/guanylate cyclase domain-containing protein [Mycobacterium malmoense]